MSDEEPKIIPVNDPGGITGRSAKDRGIIGVMRKGAAARNMEADNRLAAAAIQNQKLYKDYTVAQREAQVEVEKNRDISKYVEAAKNEVSLTLAEQEARGVELDARQKKAEAEADEVASAHSARIAQNKAEERKAEAEELRQELEIVRLRKQLERLKSDPEAELREQRQRLESLRGELDELLQAQEALLHSEHDDDELVGMQRDAVKEQVGAKRAEIAQVEQFLKDYG